MQKSEVRRRGEWLFARTEVRSKNSLLITYYLLLITFLVSPTPYLIPNP
jgi:hypothetical protein